MQEKLENTWAKRKGKNNRMEWTKEVYKSLILSEVSEAMNEFFIFIDYEIRIFEPLKFGWSEKRKNWIQSGLLHIVYWGKLKKKKNVFQKRSRRSRRTEGKNKIEITKVKGKNVKNEFSHCLTYFFLCSLLR